MLSTLVSTLLGTTQPVCTVYRNAMQTYQPPYLNRHTNIHRQENFLLLQHTLEVKLIALSSVIKPQQVDPRSQYISTQ